MVSPNVSIEIRNAAEKANVLDITGEINAAAEATLMDAYTRSTGAGAKAIILNFTNLEYMNSSGIGLLVTLLIRARRNNQRLLAYGLSEHYKQIFELTRLNEAIAIYPDEMGALAATK
jgi:anti-sigma B factor antagonist